MATKTKSFRLDDETWERFLALCQRPENKTDATKVLTTFIKQCLENDRIPTSVEDVDPVAAQLADFRIEMMALINSRIDSVTTSNDNQVGLGSKPAITEGVNTSIDSVTTVIDKVDESVNTRNDSVTTEDNVTVSSSIVVSTENRTEPIQPDPLPETEEAHPPVETEAIGNEPENEEIAAGGESTVEVVEVVESVEVKKSEGAIALKGPHTIEQIRQGLTTEKLSERLKNHPSKQSLNKPKKDPAKLAKYTLKNDPDNISWRWDSEKELYFPIDF